MASTLVPGGLESIAMGQFGSDYITDTGSHEGEWTIITALTNCVFTALLDKNATLNNTQATPDANGTDLGAVSLAAGSSIYGRFVGIVLTSGTLVAYRSSAR